MLFWGVFLLVCGFPGISTQDLDGSGPLPHSVIMDADGKYRVSWDFNKTHITFDLQVETMGYVGIGLSPNGGMPGSAMITGWVNKQTGNAYLSDRFAIGQFEPRVTFDQVSVLLSAYQNDSHTVIRFTRPLELCGMDSGQIKTDTVRLIWAYHDLDPASEVGLRYHGPNRGSKSVFLLDPYKTKPEMPTETVTFDVLNRQVRLSGEDTLYWCESFALPQLDRKHHIIKIAPVIENRAEVHHIIMYACYHPVQNSSINTSSRCYTANMPVDWWSCFSVVYGWGVGGVDFYMPAHVGIPLGYEGGPTLLMMETHYDNPRLRQGIIDSSGLRLTLTPELRRHDAGVFATGIGVSGQIIIPPFSERFRVDGHCPRECLQQALDRDGLEEVHIIGTVLHTHLAGRALRVRHYRYGIEQSVISKDDNYDFNLQEQRLLEREITLRKGDNLVTECYYGTMDKTNITHGGLSTREEMCIAFILYYPHIAMSTCTTTTTVPRLLDFMGVTLDQFNRVASPDHLRGRLWDEVLETEVDWMVPQVRQDFQDWINARGVAGNDVLCTEAATDYPINGKTVSFPRALWENHKLPVGLCPFVNQASRKNGGSLAILILVAIGRAVAIDRI